VIKTVQRPPAATGGELRKSSSYGSVKRKTGGHAKTCPSRGKRKPRRGSVGVSALLEGNLHASRQGPREPQERSGDEISPAWFWAEQGGKSVRNAEAERCRWMDPPGHTDAWDCRALKGTEPHERCSRLRKRLQLKGSCKASRRGKTRREEWRRVQIRRRRSEAQTRRRRPETEKRERGVG